MSDPPLKVTPASHVEHLRKAVGHHARIRQSAGEKAAEHYRQLHGGQAPAPAPAPSSEQ